MEADHPVAEHGEEEGRHYPHGHNVKQQHCCVVGGGAVCPGVPLPASGKQQNLDSRLAAFWQTATGLCDCKAFFVLNRKLLISGQRDATDAVCQLQAIQAGGWRLLNGFNVKLLPSHKASTVVQTWVGKLVVWQAAQQHSSSSAS